MSMQHRVEIVGARDSSFADALSRITQLSERMLVHHVELLKLDAQEQLQEGLRRIATRTIGATLLVFGWVALVAALLVTLSDRFRWDVLLLGASAFHVFVGLGLLLVSSSRRRARHVEIER